MLRLNPNNGEAHYILGMVLEKKGNYEEALREYRLAHHLDPRNLEYRKNCERLSWALPPEDTPLC
jgi:Flp pilus assembly protein TadD